MRGLRQASRNRASNSTRAPAVRIVWGPGVEVRDVRSHRRLVGLSTKGTGIDLFLKKKPQKDFYPVAGLPRGEARGNEP
jgi:hypothetical protein